MPDIQTSLLISYNVLAFLVPAGLTLLTIGAAKEKHAEQVATTALIALATAVVGYFACGFALQFGGVGLLSGSPGLQHLTAEWSPLDLAWGPGWGVVGLRGFFLSAQAYNPDAYSLFGSQLPTVITAVLITLLALCNHWSYVQLLVIGLLTSGFIYPMFGNWVWGGGWLSNLGLNVELGHGFVEVAGSATVFVLGSIVALSAFLIIKPHRMASTGPAQLPPIHFPLLMIVGALLATIGWPALVLGNPLITGLVVPSLVIVNLMFAAAGGALVVSSYSWFVTGRADALSTARGTVAGLVAASSCCAFVPAWSSLVIGSVAGVLLLLGLYVWEHVLHLDDLSGSLATFGLPGIWGTLAVAIFADGHWGVGWNGVGVQQYLGIAGQGISGYLLAEGYVPAGPSQLYAQLAGIGALLVVALLVPWLGFKWAVWIQSLGRRAVARRKEALAPPLPEEMLSEATSEAGSTEADQEITQEDENAQDPSL